jgi:hypothetical protein
LIATDSLVGESHEQIHLGTKAYSPQSTRD